MKKQIGKWVFAVVFLSAVFFLGYLLGSTQPSETATMVILDATDPDTVLPEGRWVPSYGPANRLNINTADTEDFQLLPGIGQTLAQRIVEYRESHKTFESIEELMNIEGIGQAVFNDIRHLITVGGSHENSGYR